MANYQRTRGPIKQNPKSILARATLVITQSSIRNLSVKVSTY